MYVYDPSVCYLQSTKFLQAIYREKKN
jgi:hypothetical protein